MKRSTVENYARRGLIPSIKLGRHRRFVQSDVEAALLQPRHSANGHSPRLWGRLQM
jgi:excisionase family DNA binding protein